MEGLGKSYHFFFIFGKETQKAEYEKVWSQNKCHTLTHKESFGKPQVGNIVLFIQNERKKAFKMR